MLCGGDSKYTQVEVEMENTIQYKVVLPGEYCSVRNPNYT